MMRRVSNAIDLGANLLTGIQEILSELSTRSSMPTKPVHCNPTIAGRMLSREHSRKSALEKRVSTLQASFRKHRQDCKELCRQAQALGSRVMCVLTATSEMLDFSTARSLEAIANGSMQGVSDSDSSFLQVERRGLSRVHSEEIPFRAHEQTASSPRAALVANDDMTLSLRPPQTTPCMEILEDVCPLMDYAWVATAAASMENVEASLQTPREECRLDSP
jgi:hypothetical protein